MRVHACRHCGEVFPSYSDLRQHLDSHASGHKCATCGRAFTRRDHLQRHASRCRPKPFACDVCNSSFGRKQDLDRHKRAVQCGSPPQPGPAPKRRRIASLDEDPLTPPPVGEAYDELSAGLRDFVHENWASGHTWSPDQCRRGTITDWRAWTRVICTSNYVFYLTSRRPHLKLIVLLPLFWKTRPLTV